MILNNDIYVPAFGWRMGEYQALMRLKPAIKDKIVPLISIPGVEFDFSSGTQNRSVHEQVTKFLKSFLKKWGTRPAWIALNKNIADGRMEDDRHVFDYIISELRSHESTAIPAIQLVSDAKTIESIARIVDQDCYGIGMIIRIEDLMADDLADRIAKLIVSIAHPLSSTDLIIDLRAPNFIPYNEFADALVASLLKLGDLSAFRNLVIVSTAIPESYNGVARGTDKLIRHDWLFYQDLLNTMSADMRCPNYGDYTTVHPGFVALDMRMIKPAGKIVYTTPTYWGTRKGGSFRNDPSQMHNHCQEILNDTEFQFQGAEFSFGDEFIAKCAERKAGPSNLTQWKCVVINHHVTMVVNDLARFVVAS